MVIFICNAHIPNIDALNNDTHTLRIYYEYIQKQCVGVAIEGIDIWYMGLIIYKICIKYLIINRENKAKRGNKPWNISR